MKELIIGLLIFIFLLLVGYSLSQFEQSQNKEELITKIELKGMIYPAMSDEIINKINNVQSGTINFYVTSGGGHVFSGQDIIFAIKQAQKRGVIINYYVINYAASMAAVIGCYADNVYVEDTAYVLYHTYRSADGKFILTKESLNSNPMNKILLKSLKIHLNQCKLDQKTIDLIFQGKDIVILGDNKTDKDKSNEIVISNKKEKLDFQPLRKE